MWPAFVPTIGIDQPAMTSHHIGFSRRKIRHPAAICVAGDVIPDVVSCHVPQMTSQAEMEGVRKVRVTIEDEMRSDKWLTQRD
jgi:hypothetical protein